MRILRIIRSTNPKGGGPIEAVRQTARLHVRDGHVVHVASLDDPTAAWLNTFELTCFALGPVKGRFGYSEKLVPWLRTHCEEYDCIIIEGLWQYHAFGSWRVLRNSRVPYAVFTHGMLDPWFKRTFPLKHLKKWLYWPWADYRVLRDAAAVLFTCGEERRLARQSFWLYRAKEVVVEFGTQGAPDPQRDYKAVFLAKFPELANKRRFVFLGRVHPKKGPDIIIRVLARLKTAGLWSSAKMQLIMAGPADGAYAAELKALADQLGVADGIVWTGMLQGDEKWGSLQCAEAFLLPSHQENFGIAVAESLSLGVPVLISKSVNIWSEIIADRAGFADEDTDDGCERILRQWLGLADSDRVEMGRKARAVFERRYTAEVAAESLLSHLKQIVADREAGAARRFGKE